MKPTCHATLAAVTFAILATPIPAIAQNYPPGACLIAVDVWCWPAQPTVYGEPCECPTPNGLATGITQ